MLAWCRLLIFRKSSTGECNRSAAPWAAKTNFRRNMAVGTMQLYAARAASGQPFATACKIGGLECKPHLLPSKPAAETCQLEILRGMMGQQLAAPAHYSY
jgi:hypothetical protein